MKLNRNKVDSFTKRTYYKPVKKSGVLTKKPAPSKLAKPSATARQTRPAKIEIDGIDLSLDSSDSSENFSGKKPRRLKKKRSLMFKIVTRTLSLLVLAVLVYGFFYLNKIMTASSQVLDGNIITGLLSSKPLKTDENKRTNVLVFGTAEDDGEEGHRGNEFLTDSIMIISFNQEEDDVALLNLPRDLWVKLDKPCTVGYQEKINTVFMCGSNNGVDEKAGAEALMNKVKEITGLEIHYYSHINFGGVVALVDAVDGVDVDAIGYGPVPYGVKEGSILDRNFDWKCNYRCYYVNYEPGVHHMDGEHALAFIRARNANGGYGLPNSNFDREKNQQKVINALMKKMLSAGTLSNYGKFSKILDAVGQNLRTNISADEIRSVIELASKVNFASARSLSLVDGSAGSLVGTGTSVKGTSIVQPRAGLFNYAYIQQYMKQELTDSAIANEKPKVAVLNASGEAGAAKKLSDKLIDENINVVQVGNAETACEFEAKVGIFALGDSADKKPRSLNKLAKIAEAKLSRCQIDFSYDVTADFVLVIGKQ